MTDWEGRNEEYLQLIEAILNCNSDEELNQLLSNNSNLMDEGLAQAMLSVAENMEVPLPKEDLGGSGSCLQDYFTDGITYAPSCQLLQRMQQKNKATPSPENSFFGIQNPTEDLEFADFEIETIQQVFDPNQVLVRQQATKANLTKGETIQFLRACKYLLYLKK